MPTRCVGLLYMIWPKTFLAGEKKKIQICKKKKKKNQCKTSVCTNRPPVWDRSLAGWQVAYWAVGSHLPVCWDHLSSERGPSWCKLIRLMNVTRSRLQLGLGKNSVKNSHDLDNTVVVESRKQIIYTVQTAVSSLHAATRDDLEWLLSSEISGAPGSRLKAKLKGVLWCYVLNLLLFQSGTQCVVYSYFISVSLNSAPWPPPKPIITELYVPLSKYVSQSYTFGTYSLMC